MFRQGIMAGAKAIVLVHKKAMTSVMAMKMKGGICCFKYHYGKL